MQSSPFMLVCGFLLVASQSATGGYDTSPLGADEVSVMRILTTVRQKEGGVSLSIIPEVDPEEGVESSSFETKDIPDVRLPPDCGKDFFRCSPIAVVPLSKSGESYFLFVPLNEGVLLMELSFSNKTLRATFGSYEVIKTPGMDCSPTTMFEVYEKHHTMCTDLQNKRVALYEIQVNTTAIKQSRLLGPLVTVTLDTFTSSDVENISNFLLSTAIPNQPFIYFAVDNYLFTISPVDDLPYDPTTIGRHCRYIHRLVLAPHSQLLAYCLSDFVYYDAVQEESLSEYTYAESGVPYLCPDETYSISVFEDYLRYSVGTEQHTMSHVSVESGMCLNGSRGMNVFAYNDKTADSTTLIELSTSLSTPGANKTLCSGRYCLPIIAFDDPARYLLVRHSDGNLENMTLVDVGNNLSAVITVKGVETSQMFALVRVHGKAIPDRRNHFITSVLGKLTIVGSTGGIVTLAVSIAVCVAYFYHRKYHGRQCGLYGRQICSPIAESVRDPNAQSYNMGQDTPVGQSLHDTLPRSPIPVSPSGMIETCQQHPGNGGPVIAEEIKRLDDQSLELYSTKPVDGAESTQISPREDFGRYDNTPSVAKVSEPAGDSHTAASATVSESAILSNEREQSGNTIPGELSTSNSSLDTDSASIDSTVDSVLQPLIPNNDS